MVGFPVKIISGETLTASFACSDSSAVTAFVVGTGKHEFAFDLDGSTWKASESTDGWDPGAHQYEVWATLSDGTRRVLERGRFEIEASLGDLPAGTDTRSLAVRMVEMIEAMIAGNATAGVKRYRINNRELERYSVTELLDLLKYWQNRVRLEDRKARGASALGPRIAFEL